MENIEKMRVVVSHSDEKITNNISNAINNFEYAEVVGTANTGKGTYDKIVELKPDIVFSKYNMEDMNGFEIIKSSKEKLEDKIPTFNMIIDNTITDGEVDKMYDIIGKKLNSLVSDPIIEDVINVMKNYNNK